MPSPDENWATPSPHSAKTAENPGKSNERRVPRWYTPPLAETALETIVLISPAWAQGAPAGASGPGYEQFFIIIGMFALLYFLMIRPQMKRSKEHKQMTEALQKGDEVITSGGVLGKITKIGDTYASIEIAPNTEVQMQRSAIQTLLPKGTIKSI